MPFKPRRWDGADSGGIPLHNSGGHANHGRAASKQTVSSHTHATNEARASLAATPFERFISLWRFRVHEVTVSDKQLFSYPRPCPRAVFRSPGLSSRSSKSACRSPED